MIGFGFFRNVYREEPTDTRYNCVRWDTATEFKWRLNNMARSRALISRVFTRSMR